MPGRPSSDAVALPRLTESEQGAVRASVPPMSPVGYVRSTFRTPGATPIQSTRSAEAIGRIEIFPEFVGCLDGLAGFDFAWVITWLDRAADMAPDGRVVPFMLAHTGERVGTFATRHPARPNPLGLSVVRVIEVADGAVTFRGVDLCHATPVLDVKPWQQDLDVPGYAQGWEAVRRIRGGWYEASGAIERGQVLPGQVDPSG